MRIGVILPVLDEEKRIAARLRELAFAGFPEVVVVDGGSSDRTRAIVRGFPAARLLQAPRGRGRQMNAGARSCDADVLLFLHADVQLPVSASAQIERVLGDARIVAGAFRTHHVAEEARPILAALLPLADLRSRYTRLPYGDQALFVRRDAFERAGGFPDQPLFEDLELSRRLRKLGRIATLPEPVRVSGRRFLERPLRTFLAFNLFPLLYGLGVAPSTLRRAYGDVR